MIGYEALEDLRNLVDYAQKTRVENIPLPTQTVEDLLGSIVALQKDGQNADHVVDERGQLRRELAAWQKAIESAFTVRGITPDQARERITWLRDEGGKITALKSRLRDVNDLVATMKGI